MSSSVKSGGSRPSKNSDQKQNKSLDGSESIDEDKQDDDESLKPCTKIPCQQVLRAIAELETKNENERIDLEDDIDRLTQDLHQSLQEIGQSEARLSKLNELGDQLEMALTKILSQVEAVEQKNQALVDERAEINTKLMLLEVERQKQNRKLEKISKQVTDARWRKKKKAQQQDVDSGLSYPPSEIVDRKIIQKDDASVKRDADVSSTSYNSLARDGVVDYLERPMTLKTVHPVLAEDFLRDYPQEFDKYAQMHYRKQISKSIESWQSIQDTTLACDVRSHPKYSHCQSPNRGSPTGFLNSSSASTISRTSPGSFSLKKPLSIISKSGQLPDASAQQRVGQTLSNQVSREVEHRRQLVKSMHDLVGLVQSNPQQAKGSGFKLQASTSASLFRDPNALTLQRPISPSSRPTTAGDNILNQASTTDADAMSASASLTGSLGAANSALSRRLNYKPTFHKKTKKSTSLFAGSALESPSSMGNGQIRLTPLNLNGSGSANGLGLSLGHLTELSTMDNMEEEYLEKMEQDGIFLPVSSQSSDPVDPFASGLLSNSASFYSNTGPSEQKPRIDDVFYRSTAQTHWGRSHKLGEVRSKVPVPIVHTVVHPIVEHTGDAAGKNESNGKKKIPKVSYKTVSGLTVVDMRRLPRLHPRTLTMEHPGMTTFESAQDLFAGGPGGAPSMDSTSRTK